MIISIVMDSIWTAIRMISCIDHMTVIPITLKLHLLLITIPDPLITPKLLEYLTLQDQPPLLQVPNVLLPYLSALGIIPEGVPIAHQHQPPPGPGDADIEPVLLLAEADLALGVGPHARHNDVFALAALVAIAGARG